MDEWYYVGAYWGARKETALECARRAELLFQLWLRYDPAFTQWYRSGRGAPRMLPGHPIRLEVSEWEKLFLRGRARRDVGKTVIEEFGSRVHVWTTKTVEQTVVMMSCGAYSTGAVNTCLFYPPREGPLRERILNAPMMADVLTSMATAWDPDFAVVTSSQMLDLVEKHEGEVRVGWLTYLSRRLGTVPPLPAPVRIEPVGTLGWLLVLSPERMTVNNPEHVAFTTRVRELLDRAGLIQRPES